MSHRTALLASLLFALALGSAGAAEKPNVLLISIDDLNDWVGCLEGHPQAKTPHLDALASNGTLFERAYCQSPVCNPSRASLWTGRYPHRTGIYFLAPGPASAPSLKDVPTLPEVFARHGYEVAGAGKLFHGAQSATYFGRAGSYAGGFGGFGPRPAKKISQPHGHPLWDWGAFPEQDKGMPDFRIATWGVEALQKEYDKPFFLAVGFYRPHVPMYVPQRWFEMHPREGIQLPLVRADDRADLSEYAKDLTTLEHVAPLHDWMREAGQWEHAVQAYLASTSFVDAQVGRILAALEQSPHRDDTIVVLFSDHGFHLGEKERWAKRTLWEDSVRVPLIVVDPRRATPAGGQVSKKPVGLIDLFPTLLELCGLPADPQQDGQSLLPLLEDPATSQWSRPALSQFGPGNYALRSEHHRYIRYKDGSEELYDHRNDPHEWDNLAVSKSSDSTIRALLERHRKQLPEQEHSLLPGKSTGHLAFAAAEVKRIEREKGERARK